MADSKMMVYAVAALVVGAAVGVGIGYIAFHGGSGSDSETYWFYLDFGGHEGEGVEDQWVEVSSNSPLSALRAALDKTGMGYNMSGTGWIVDIGGVGEDENMSWGSWFWNTTVYDASWTSTLYPNWIDSSGFDITVGNVFYLGYTEYDPVSYEYLLDPNADLSVWSTTGPFA